MNLGVKQLHAGLLWVLDTALDAVVVMDQQGFVQGWNAHAEHCFGWSAEEAIGRRLSDLLIPESLRDAHERGLAHYLATGEGRVLDQRIEVSAVNRDGQEFPVELSITASELFGEKVFVGFLHEISERQEAAERQQRLLQESDHRIKNMLTVVSSIAAQTARASTDLPSFIASFSARLDGLARAHSLLVSKTWSEVAVSALAEQVLGPDVALGRACFGGPEVLLPPRKVLGLSMILNELYTNAVKYGALCGDDGMVAVDWATDGDALVVRWVETGPTCRAETTSSGFGSRMIAMAVKADLNGTIEREWKPEGLTAVLRFPHD